MTIRRVTLDEDAQFVAFESSDHERVLLHENGGAEAGVEQERELSADRFLEDRRRDPIFGHRRRSGT